MAEKAVFDTQRLNKTINTDDCKFSTFFMSDGVINFLKLLSRLTSNEKLKTIIEDCCRNF